MKLKSIKSLKNVKGKRVLIRVDFNVPFMRAQSASEAKNLALPVLSRNELYQKTKGRKPFIILEDDSRIREALPTIEWLQKKGAKIIIITHLGRPKGVVENSLRVGFISTYLEKLLKRKVNKIDASVGLDVEETISLMKPGDILLLENIRFHPEEELCEPAFVKALAKLGDIYVNEGFSVSHRKHASTAGIAKFLPSYAGFLLEKEITALTPLLKNPLRPITLIMGGAKIKDKIGVIKHFFKKADFILVGGGLANTFLAAAGYDVGKSFYEPEKVPLAQEIMLLAEKYQDRFFIPEDVVVASEMKENAKTLDLPLEDIEGDMKIFDIGSRTKKRYSEIIHASRTIIWNGPMGVFEYKPFRGGTKAVAEAIAGMKDKAKTYLGGGDTIAALSTFRIPHQKFTHVSMGGGAMLEFLEGKKLPGIQVLVR